MFALPDSRNMSSTAWSAGSHLSPFNSYAAGSVPQNWKSVLEWCQHLFVNNGTYRAAMDRVISYFITEIDIGAATPGDSLGEEETIKWETLLNKQLDAPGFIRLANLDAKCYGNFFASVHVPFKRLLQCKRCHSVYVLNEMANTPQFQFRFTNFEFHAKCPNSECAYSGAWDVNDRPDTSAEKISLKLWPPQEIELLHDLYSNDVSYLWRIPEDYKNQIRQGKLYNIERVSMQVLQAIKHNQLFLFNDDIIFHGREPGPTGIRTRGWGFSPLLFNSRMIWYVELLHRQNEALAMDYVVPLRIIAPDFKGTGPGVSDPLHSQNGAVFHQQIRRMVENHRKNPTSWSTLPFPVAFQQLSGDANKMVTKDILDQGYDILLNASGVPQQFYRGTMDANSTPMQMRLLEAMHHPMVHRNNSFLDWLCERVCQILSWEPVSAKFLRAQHADDVQRQMAVLQLATGGRVSETDALRTLGLNRRDQRRQLMEEARFDQEEQARMQEEMDQAAFGQQVAKGQQDPNAQGAGGAPGAAPPGGAPPQGGDPSQGGQMPAPAGSNIAAMIPGGGNPMTPEAMEDAANSVAQSLLSVPASQRLSELRSIQQKNPTFHKLVKGHLDQIRSQARSQGGQQMLQQQFGGG